MNEITVKTTVKGFFKKKITFEIIHGNRTDYAYSLTDLATILINEFEINRGDLWLLMSGIEQKYYKIQSPKYNGGSY